MFSVKNRGLNSYTDDIMIGNSLLPIGRAGFMKQVDSGWRKGEKNLI